MSPKTAIFFFLVAASLSMALLLPSEGEARLPSEKTDECTLGSCPLVLSASDDGRELNYPLGSKITILTANKPTLLCHPEDAAGLLAFSPLSSNSISFEAKSRGTCSIRSDELNVKLNFYKFR